jgi:hypothetical protein
MSSVDKLTQSKNILEKELSIHVRELFFEPKLARIRIILRDGVMLYVQYNNHDQYGYSVIFSSNELDRCRFDNYDKNWKVSSQPHHFHPRNTKDGFDSPMVGKPDSYIPVFCELVKKGTLLDKEHRFFP